MRELLGTLIFVNGLGIGIFLLAQKNIDWKGFLAIGVVALFGGFIVGNMPNIKQLMVSGGKAGTITVEMQQQVERVETRADEVDAVATEVRGLKEQVQLLVTNANKTNEAINESKVSVERLVEDATNIRAQVNQARDGITQTSQRLRDTWISFIEAFYFAMQTRNMFPPPQPVMTHINQHLNHLAELAFPNPQERAQWTSPALPLRDLPNRQKWQQHRFRPPP